MPRFQLGNIARVSLVLGRPGASLRRLCTCLCRVRRQRRWNSCANWNNVRDEFLVVSRHTAPVEWSANRFSSESLDISPLCPTDLCPSRTRSIGCHRKWNLAAANMLCSHFQSDRPPWSISIGRCHWRVRLCSNLHGRLSRPLHDLDAGIFPLCRSIESMKFSGLLESVCANAILQTYRVCVSHSPRRALIVFGSLP